MVFLLVERHGPVDQTDEIIGGKVVISAKQRQVVDFQLRAAGFDMVVALLGLVQYLSQLCLGQVPVLADISQPLAIIHKITPKYFMEQSYNIQTLSIDKYSNIEYHVGRKYNLIVKMKGAFSMRRCIAVLLSMLLLTACGAGGQAPASLGSVPESSTEPSSSSSVETEPVETEPSPEEAEPEIPNPPESPDPESSAPEAPAVEPPVPEGRPSGPNLSEDGLILPPQVPHGIALDGLGFSRLDKTGIVSLLEPVLERAQFFCRFGCKGEFDDKLGIEMDFSPEATIQRPYRTWDEMPFYPCLNLSYQTVEELKQDMCTVFTPDILENNLAYVFDGLIDFEGKIYCVGGSSGYTREHYWELDKMEIVSAEETKLTISAPVSAWGPSGEVFTAQLNFEMVDGYIIMDSSYFATHKS